ncbi:MAG: hypothetical protein C0475_05025 [Planctomyces sp.]|nr:hypothetical protein [Planctomyces sp.]MBA4120139.1 hypothetical protein [Isosphaera sp.]
MSHPAPPVAVIGAGVVGLTTALAILRRGVPVTIYAQDPDAPQASSVAPAMFTPYAGPAPDRLRRWVESSWRSFVTLAARSPESGVSMSTLREAFYHRRPTEPWLADLLQPRPLPPRPPYALVRDTTRPAIDMLVYLPWLRGRATAAGAALVRRRLQRLHDAFDAGHRTLVHCAGLGAGPLASDPAVRPMHGQVVHAPNDIHLGHSIHDDAAAPGSAYVFRFPDRLVIGSTFQPDRPEPGTDEPTLDDILRRARALLALDGLPTPERLGAVRIQVRGAARPARGSAGVYEDVRLEAESLAGGRRIVHNYGHGRMGVTVSWGTAEEAADLALRP